MIELIVEESRARKAVIATIKYAVALIITGLLLPGFLFGLTGIEVISIFCQFLVFPLAIAYVGRILEIVGIQATGLLMKLVFAPVVYTYLFLTILFEGIAVGVNSPHAVEYAFPTVILLSSAYVLFFGTRIIDSHLGTRRGLIGLYSTKVSKYILMISLGFYLNTLSTYNVLFPAFFLAGMTGFVVNSWVLISDQSNSISKNFSHYFRLSGARWVGLMGLIGFFYGLLLVPKAPIYNEALFIAFIIIASFTVIFLALKVYVATSRYVDRLVATTYKKYEYSSDLVTSRELDYISHATRQFITEGDSNPLVIAFSALLSKRDLQLAEIDSILRPLTSYYGPNVEVMFNLNIRKGLERRMRERHDIIQRTMRRISKMEENELWKQETRAV